jgi:hypothetical protein
VTVETPDVDITELDWPEAALLAHFAFGTPNAISAEYEAEPGEGDAVTSKQGLD